MITKVKAQIYYSLQQVENLSNFGEADATLKAYYEQKGERLINGSKNYLDGMKELRKAYNI